jgi:hypothetical protein
MSALIQDIVTVRIPVRFQRRSAAPVVVMPEEGRGAPKAYQSNDSLRVALGKAYRWHRMLETGEVATIAEIAHLEKVSQAHAGRVLRLMLLAPAVIEAILDQTNSTPLRTEAAMGLAFRPWNDQIVHIKMKQR